MVESLTTEIGPRIAGSEADARAVAWAEAKFKALGFDKVWKEPVTFPKWERRSEHAAVTGKNPQPLQITALGGSPGGTVEAEVVRFADLAALQAAPAGSLKGKIAFVDYQMLPFRDGRDYGRGGAIRSKGPSEAIRKGAVGFLMRSAGTDSHRVPHTGITRFDDGLTPVPSAALSVPDADQLARLLARGSTTVKVALDCGWDGTATSYNVIGEITGRSLPKEVVVIGGHLDSWDLGTGAVDDGAGVGITMAAGHLIGQLKQAPKRTIRVIAFANEEQGLYGGKAYAEAHAKDVALHQLAAESDFGAGRIYAFNTGSPNPEGSREATKQIAEVMKPLGIEYQADKGPGPGRRPAGRQGRCVGVAGAGRLGLLPPAPHRRRHAGQDRPEGTSAERGRLHRVCLPGGRSRWQLRQRGQGDHAAERMMRWRRAMPGECSGRAVRTEVRTHRAMAWVRALALARI